MKNTEKSTFAVTGATGYLASHIVKQLLEAGHTVHATVRWPDQTEKYAHLTAIAEKAPGELKIFGADLLIAGSFDEALKGCNYLIHTASPFITGKIKNPYEQLIRPALEGTKGVLESVNRAPEIGRVVLTSSVVAIMGDGEEAADLPDNTFTEKHWNTSSSEKHQPYAYSKTLAEKAAWEMAGAQKNWSLATINPGFILGPSITKRADSESIRIISLYGKGEFKAGVPDIYCAVVDVRDAARAHILAAFSPEAAGKRYITAAKTLNFLDFAEIIRQKYPTYPLPKKKLPKWLVWLVGPLSGLDRKYISKNIGYPIYFDNSLIQKDLGMAFRPTEETLHEQFAQLLEDGHISKKG